MSQQPPPQLATPPILQYLPPPPPAVTGGVSALRVACAQWAPQRGGSDHQVELHACDAVLDRDTQFSGGFSLGIMAALTAVCFYGVCRSAVRARTCGRAEDIAAYCVLGFCGLGPGLVLGGAAIWQFGQDWSRGLADLALWGSVAASWAGLATARWAFLARVRAASAGQPA